MKIEFINLAVIAACIIVMAIAHTVQGERNIVRPIVKRMTWKGTEDDAWYYNGTVRFAWHIITVAWIGLATMLCGGIRR